jgi:Arylsulfotransferase (ASST)
VVRVFDNGNVRSADRRATRVLTLRLDRSARAATQVAALRHPTRLSAGTQGNAAALPGSDHLLVSWGSRGRVSELGPDGGLLFDLLLPPEHDTYRAYRAPWPATPLATPRVVARGTTVAMSWNGATEVQRWRVLGGASRDALAPLREAPWRGLETRTRLAAPSRYVAVEALDAAGTVLRRSAVVRRSG